MHTARKRAVQAPPELAQLTARLRQVECELAAIGDALERLDTSAAVETRKPPAYTNPPKDFHDVYRSLTDAGLFRTRSLKKQK